jgi:hypothetical protein
MIIDYQDSYIDQQTLNKTIAGRNPDITKPSSSIKKKQQLNSKTISQQQKPKRDYELPPLILEGVNLSWVALNNFLVKKVPDLKCNNIVYNDKSRNFTIYPSNVAVAELCCTCDWRGVGSPNSLWRIRLNCFSSPMNGRNGDVDLYS